MFSCPWGTGFGAHGGFMGGGLFGMLWSVLLLVLAAYLIVRLFQAFSNTAGPRRDRNDSMEILREKFARGEISSEEYDRMREVLAN